MLIYLEMSKRQIKNEALNDILYTKRSGICSFFKGKNKITVLECIWFYVFSFFFFNFKTFKIRSHLSFYVDFSKKIKIKIFDAEIHNNLKVINIFLSIINLLPSFLT